MPRVVTTIGLPSTLKERLEELAREDDRSLNNLMVMILRQAVKEDDQVEGREEREYVE